MDSRFWTDRFFFREFKENNWPAVHRYAKQERVSRYQRMGNGWRDSMIYSVLEQEWQNGKP